MVVNASEPYTLGSRPYRPPYMLRVKIRVAWDLMGFTVSGVRV